MRIGFDIGGTSARRVIVDGRKIVSELTVQSRGWEAAQAQNFIKNQVDDCEEDIDAVGIALAAQLSTNRRRVLNAPNLDWRHVDFLDGLHIEPNAYLYNDLNAAMWGEYKKGVARRAKGALGVFVGTGVGGAIVWDGKIHRGASGVAGEIGHVKVSTDTSARRCGCGQRGCLEAYVGGISLEERVNDALPLVAKQRGVGLSRADALFADNSDIERIWRESAGLLATAIANAVTILNPEILVLGGGVISGAENFRTMVVKQINNAVSETAASMLEIKFAALPQFGGAIGAALLTETE